MRRRTGRFFRHCCGAASRFAPKGTPQFVVAKLQKDFAAVLQMPDVKQNLEKQGAQPSGMPTAEFARFVQAERAKFQAIVKAGSIKQH